MSDNKSLISDAFKAFATATPEHAKAWMELTSSLAEASALDAKTGELAYLAVLAALGRTSGIPFHADQAIKKGASKAEILSAILVGLPAAGHIVTQALPPALEVLDDQG